MARSAYRGSLKALPIELPETRRPIGLITLKKRDLSPVAKLFVNCAREVVKPLANRNDSPQAGSGMSVIGPGCVERARYRH